MNPEVVEKITSEQIGRNICQRKDLTNWLVCTKIVTTQSDRLGKQQEDFIMRQFLFMEMNMDMMNGMWDMCRMFVCQKN